MKEHIKFTKLLFTIIILIVSFKSYSQYYIVGQDPASISWKQLNSEYFKIIYPDGYQKKAQEYINLLEMSHKSISLPYLKQNKKLQVVLHNRSVVSNAMVSPTPIHADFFEMPGQDTYAQEWAKQLTLHEYRHAVQMQKLNQGTTKALKYLFGDQAIGGVLGVFIPFWFIEGDAVFSETIFSKSGRGRSPDFTMDIAAQVVEKKIYSYDKAQFGSYKDYTPDHYTLGYQLVTYGNINYGLDLWNSMLNNVARKPYTFVPFTKSIKKVTGTGKVGYYKKVMESRKTSWKSNADIKVDYQSIRTKEKKDYTNYRFINPVSDGSIIVEKMGIDDINRFVKIFPNGDEKILFTPGYDFMDVLSANDSLICWNEKTFDPRWSNRNYSVIKIFNYKTKKLKQLSHRSRLFAPSLANHKGLISAIKVTENNQYSLVTIDIHTGEIINEFSTPENLFFMHPSWSADDKYIVSTVLGKDGKSIIKINTKTYDYEFLIPFGYTNISRPILNGSNLLFTGAYTGTDNIYLFNTETQNVRKITNAKFGATDATFAFDESKILFSNYTSDGFITSTTDIANGVEINIHDTKYKYFIDSLSVPNNFIIDNKIIPDSSYTETKYSKIGHLFNPHSWGLAAVDLNNYDFQPGVNILTQNILSTSYGSVGYYYDQNENAGKFKAGFTYAGWYPEINLQADYGLRRLNYVDTNNVKRELKWMETNLKAGISVPLHLTKSVWVMGVTPGVSIDQKFLDVISDHQFTEDQVTSISYNIFAYTQYKKSLRDIYPKWGFNTNIFFKHTPFSGSVSRIFGWAETFYFPGILSHHGIRIYSAYQVNEKGNYSYSNMVSTPRGYTGVSLNNLISLKSEYAFPVVYPDLNIPSLMYLKRITMHAYFDYATGDNYHGGVNSYSSTGIELYSDWHFLSLIPNISLGIRGNYRFFDDSINFEFLYGFSIN